MMSITESVTSSTTVKVNDIGVSFVPQYYTCLSRDPSRLHLFYTKNSSLLHGVEGDMEAPVAFGPEAIQAAVAKSNFAGCRFTIQNIDCLPSLNGGILVNVLGKMHSKTTPTRAFAQTFFLAEQPSGYFILNDNLRFLADAVVETAEPAIEKVAEPAPVEAAKEAPKEAVAAAAVTEPVKESIAEATTPATTAPTTTDAPVADAPKATKKSAPKAAKPVEKPVEEELPPSGPSSWAQLAAVQQSKWASGVVAPAKGTSIVEAKPVSAAKPRTAESKPRNGEAQSRPTDAKKSTPSTNNSQQQQSAPKKIPFVPEASLYVTGVTDALKAEDIKAVFSALGSLAHFDVNRRSGAAFVEYEDAGIAKLVLGQGSVSVNGVTLTVEKRRVNTHSGRRDSGNNNHATNDQSNKKFTPTNNHGKRGAPKSAAN